jgi:hypothetical protein
MGGVAGEGARCALEEHPASSEITKRRRARPDQLITIESCPVRAHLIAGRERDRFRAPRTITNERP